MTAVAALTDEGLQGFAQLIEAAVDSPIEPLRTRLLSTPSFSRPISGPASVEERAFGSKLELAQYLFGRLKAIDRRELDSNFGLWSWLALYYFDALCPMQADGKRDIGKAYYYILSGGYRHYYRHLVAAPFTVFRLHGEAAATLLSGPASTHGDMMEQLASRMEFVTNRGLIQALARLYGEPSAGGGVRAKRGATSRGRPGTLRRFISVVQQLDLTYDVYGMSESDILALLPGEFGRWLAKEPLDAEKRQP